MDALWLWNIALASTACGNLLNLIENAYGYPESKASIERGSYLETVEWDFAENMYLMLNWLVAPWPKRLMLHWNVWWGTSIKKKEDKFPRSG